MENDLKLAEVNTISKKSDDLDKENYVSIKVLISKSKFFEGIMYNQTGAKLYKFMQDEPLRGAWSFKGCSPEYEIRAILALGKTLLRGFLKAQFLGPLLFNIFFSIIFIFRLC